MTWAEFVEARLFRSPRVPMAEPRASIDELRRDYGAPCSLAHRKPYISGHQLVLKAQEAVQVHADFLSDRLCLQPADPHSIFRYLRTPGRVGR